MQRTFQLLTKNGEYIGIVKCDSIEETTSRTGKTLYFHSNQSGLVMSIWDKLIIAEEI